MGNLEKLAPLDEQGSWNVVVESPRGATVKLVYDPARQTFRAARPLPLGLHYPYDWGFIPSTEAPDGDAVDALVLWDATSAPGTILACRLVGVVELEESSKDGARQRNDRVLAVPVVSERDRVVDARDLARRYQDELGNFFIAVARLEGKDPRVLGVRGPSAAEQLVRGSLRGRSRRAA